MDTVTFYPTDISKAPYTDPVKVSTSHKQRDKLIYVAGKYDDERGDWFIECNIREAEQAAQFIWMNGGIAICPHLNTYRWGGLLPREAYLEGDFEIIRRCDAIYMLPNWINSPGAQDEHAVAMVCEIPILYSSIDVLLFLGIDPDE